MANSTPKAANRTLPRPKRSSAPLLIRPRVRVWLEADGQHVFCARMCRILEAVHETGSIKEAAATVGLSYRYVWARIKESEAALGRTLVETHVGGRDSRRSGLTELGNRLVVQYADVRQKLQDASDGLAETLREPP